MGVLLQRLDMQGLGPSPVLITSPLEVTLRQLRSVNFEMPKSLRTCNAHVYCVSYQCDSPAEIAKKFTDEADYEQQQLMHLCLACVKEGVFLRKACEHVSAVEGA